MIRIKRKVENNLLNIVLNELTGKEYIYFDGQLVSESRSFKKNQHKFQILKGNGSGHYEVSISGNFLNGTVIGSILFNSIEKDNFRENPFQTSTYQKILFLIISFILTISWIQFWSSIGFTQNLGMLISLLAPFIVVMLILRLMVISNMKKRGFWISKVDFRTKYT